MQEYLILFNICFLKYISVLTSDSPFYFMAMYNTSMGPTHVTRLLTGLNIPSLHPKTLRKRTIEVTSHIQVTAQDSCKKALEAELATTIESSRYICMLLYHCISDLVLLNRNASNYVSTDLT